MKYSELFKAAEEKVGSTHKSISINMKWVCDLEIGKD